MSGTLTLTRSRPRPALLRDTAATLHARAIVATDAVDIHVLVCGCLDEPCSDALRLAETEMEAWDRFEVSTN